MDLRDDERAQTVQVGAILLLGTLVIALAVYQVTSVPGQNGATEFTHNQQIHEQLQEVRNAILDAAATGRSRSARVRLGTQYRDRIVAVNPGPPSGTLRTRALSDTSAIRLENARTVDGTTGCWDGTDRELATKTLVYRPDYNEYRRAPTTVYENSVLYDRFEGEGENDVFINASGQRLVNGRQITLVALGGSYAESQSGTVSVDARPAGSATEPITLTNSTDEPLTLSVSTNLSQEVWRDLLVGELVANGGHIRAPPRVESGTLIIELERGVDYDVSLSQVTLGTGSSVEGLRCLTGVSGNNSAVPEGESQELVFEVYDQYNTPVSNEDVSLAIDGPGNLSNERVRTDDRGRVTVRYDAPSNVDGPDRPVTVRATTNDSLDLATPAFDRRELENVAYDLTAENTDGSLAAIRWNRTAIGDQPGMTCTNDSCTYDPASDDDGTFEVFAEGEPPAVTNLTFASTNTDVAEYTRQDDVTDSRGRATATVIRRDSGNTTFTVSGGGERDALPITISNREPTADFEASPGETETGQRVAFDARNSTDPDGDTLTYEWDFGDGNTTTTSLPTTDHVYGDDGTYEVTLTVVDEHGGRSGTTGTIAISNRPPTAEFTPPQNPGTGEPAAFDASASDDPDGSIERYEWDFGDGSSDATNTATTDHTYDEPGTYVVTLRVTDDDGDTDVIQRSVAVAEREQVLLDEDFENGVPSGWYVQRFDSSARAGLSQQTSNSGSTSVFHRSGAGVVGTPALDTSGASEVEIEYWIRKGADSFSENPDANEGEDFIVEYRNANGNWVEIDRIEDTVPPGAQFTRTETVSTSAAAHDGFRIRFRQEGATNEDGDVWHFDDVKVTRIG